ncbi:ABC transporter ATP-binding protein [Roseomonas sp. NAR14]|uniref:ABC transporter ATP-binding protein n=1 Tax=Roseomonas acroporae TaxID=2937791 RepID=A0A9X1Y3H5_9PROT|nr:ABC transporter ATP-binding protein [Roseomonas acroporae]MCK8783484.1 ABC transporter ATP-binding protein [Roseomonas acroporae]
MTATLLRFEGVDKSWADGTPVLQGLDLAVPEGEATVLLGPGGSGKAMALALAAGLHAPDSGRILLRDRDLAGLPPERRGTVLVSPAQDRFPAGLVPERGGGLWRWRRTGPGPRGGPGQGSAQGGAQGATLTALLDRLDRDGLAFLARGLAAPAGVPPVLLLDEPFEGLDPAARLGLRLSLRTVQRRLGLTLLHATRDPYEAMLLADRLAVLDGGVLQQVGTPRQVYERPATARAARALGEVNLLPGVVLSAEDGECRVLLDAGPTVEARQADVAGAGTRCVVALRPERVVVAPVEAEMLGEGALPARLLETVFLGDHVRLRLALGEGGARRAGELLVTRPATGGALPQPGGPAAVALPVAHCHVCRPPDAA